MRDLNVVIDRMVENIPVDQVDLIDSLNDVKDMMCHVDSRYAPPESTTWWDDTQRVLRRYIFTDALFVPDSWHEVVRKIWTDEED